MNKFERGDILAQIKMTESKLAETVDFVERGPVKDALRVVVPMMQDQLALIRMLVEKLGEDETTNQRSTT